MEENYDEPLTDEEKNNIPTIFRATLSKDQYIDILIPPKYLVCGNGITYEKSLLDKQGNPFKIITKICDTSVGIIAYLLNESTKELFYMLGYTTPYGVHKTIIVPQFTLLTAKGVLDLLKHEIIFSDEDASAMVEYFREILVLNKGKLPTKILYDTMGWKDDYTSFILGNKKISKDKTEGVEIDGIPKSIANAFNCQGNIKDWLYGTRKLLTRYINPRFACYAAVTSIILRKLGLKPIMVNFWEETSEGKTLINKLCISLYGSPEELIFSAHGTEFSFELLMSVFYDVPINFDDIQMVEKEKSMKLVYMIGNGIGKGRGLKTLKLKEFAHWNMVVLTTGETPWNDEQSFGGASLRVWDINGGVGAVDEEAVDDFEKIKRDHYGHIAPILIRKIISDLDRIEKMYLKNLDEIPKDIKKNKIVNRMNDTLAAFITGGMLFEEIMKELGEETRDPNKICKDILEGIIGKTAMETYPQRIIKHIYSWIDENPKNFFVNGSPNPNFIGEKENAPYKIYGNLRDGGITLEIFNKSFDDEIKRAGFDVSRARAEMKKLGLISAKKLSSTINKVSGRVVVINTNLVEAKYHFKCPISDVPIQNEKSGAIDMGLA